jgi:hypothetical protein
MITQTIQLDEAELCNMVQEHLKKKGLIVPDVIDVHFPSATEIDEGERFLEIRI